jgi:hypothetical protein
MNIYVRTDEQKIRTHVNRLAILKPLSTFAADPFGKCVPPELILSLPANNFKCPGKK